MTNPANPRRRPSVHITLQRAARLHRLVRFLATSPRTRASILSDLRIGLRTFYRELELLKRCGVKIRHKTKLYDLVPTAFAEMAELAQCPCPAGKRLAELLASVISQPETPRNRPGKKPRRKKAGP
jgi:hypothetical protein